MQGKNTQVEFQDRAKLVITQMSEQSLNAAVFFENPDPRSYVSMVPTSAATGDGMGNLLALIVELTQTVLSKRLMYSNELQATVLEVKAIPGYGTTIGNFNSYCVKINAFSLLQILKLTYFQQT